MLRQGKFSHKLYYLNRNVAMNELNAFKEYFIKTINRR